MSFGARFFFAWACFFRVLFDGAFAARASAVRDAMPAPPPAALPPKEAARETKPEPVGAGFADGALALLALLQREGRLVDFLEQDVATFSDADVGTAARVVHEGCRRALRQHVTIVASCKEEEGAPIEVETGFDPNRMKLTGNVSGKGPWRGTVRHRGWIAEKVSLPEPMAGHDAKALAPAEVEL
jgi:hypothetical protein